MSKSKRFNKEKLDWTYSRVIEDKYVNPADVVVLQSPLEPSLTFSGDSKQPVLHLRTCLEGIDENGIIRNHLYCTSNDRYFDLQKDGWHEHKPSYAPNGAASKNGGCNNYTFMRHFGGLRCHKLVAHAWVENRYHYLIEVCDDKTAKMQWTCTHEVDHIDGDALNNNADNLQYVLPAENTRRRKIVQRMRKAGDDPKLHSREDLLRIFTENNVAGDVYEGE